jgi:hypothetical protein
MKKIIAIAVILAGVVLFTIGNTIQMYSTISIIEKRLADKEHAVDTVSAKVDTLTFEQEMAIVDSAIKAQGGIVYKSIYEVPNREVHYKYGEWHQTIVRHPNGMPKITAGLGKDGPTEYRVYGFFLLFLDENGRLIAQGERAKIGKLGRWHCEAQPDTLVRFNFSNPNTCRNLK